MPSVLFEDRGAHFGREVLSVCACAVLSVSLESAMERRKRDNDVYCAESLSGAMWSAVSVSLEKKPFGGNASL